MQAVIARPFDPNFNLVPQSTAEWKARVEKVALAAVAGLPRIREALGVTFEPGTIGGVKVFVITPKAVAPQNRDRVLCIFTAASECSDPANRERVRQF
jgi:epsilon-lactone hydrolase